MDCIFCKIVNGIIPSAVVYEDEYFKAILDIAPANKGHVIIITKNHYKDLLELGVEESENILKVAKKITEKLTDTLGVTEFNILQNNGHNAGQTVYHYHCHIIPRFANDDVSINWKVLKVDADELNEIAKKLS